MLEPGDLLPHFEVRTLAGDVVRYATIWQHRNLVLVVLPRTSGDAIDGYVAEVSACAGEFRARETACVVTDEPPAGFDTGVFVADRWGELAHATHSPSLSEFPDTDAILEWVDYVRMKCPECEGETR